MSPTCTHDGGPLEKGLVVGDTIRCPWHHACFSLRTGEALGAPAFDPIACWAVERDHEKVLVRGKREDPGGQPAPKPPAADTATRIVIVGGGAVGFAAAEMLRRRGFDGDLSLLTADDAAPYDRPNLSKDYLAGEAPEDWIPLRPPAFYQSTRIDLHLGVRADRIDAAAQVVACADGRTFPQDWLLLATGAEPIRLSIPGADLPHVHTLRSLADSRAIIERARTTRHADVLDASFIGLKVAAALRARALEVHVVAPERRPMEKVLGPQLGDLIRALHQGAWRELSPRGDCSGHRSRYGDPHGRRLSSCGLVVVGIGVRPRTELAERSGLAVERGIVVDGYLETSVPGIFAAGDIARWPDLHSGEAICVEHWVVAEQQGQTAAPSIGSACASATRPSPSSGASITISRSGMSDMPSGGI